MFCPVAAFDPAYTTPFAALTYPMSTAPCGSGVCQRIFPVAASRAAHEPPVVVWPAKGPEPPSVYG
jgi:hypothetical protein